MYKAVVVEQNSWSPITGLKIIKGECGHNHRTLEAAVKCMLSKARTLADWHFSSTIRRTDGELMEACEISEMDHLHYSL